MKFLDKQEQVMDLQLTQHGKRLYQSGKFKPAFYAFYDDDVLYDSQYGGFTEPQNYTVDRIKSETPRFETQAIYSGIETNVKQIITDIRDNPGKNINEAFFLQPTHDKHYAMQYPLGNAKVGAKTQPAVQVNFHYGILSGAMPWMSGSQTWRSNSDHRHKIVIPQLDTEIVTITQPDYIKMDYVGPEEYYTSLAGLEGPSVDWGLTGIAESEGYDVSEVAFHNDGTFLKVVGNGLLLEILEDSAVYQKENFEIEVYEVEKQQVEQPNGEIKEKEVLLPLYFKDNTGLIMDGILINPMNINNDYQHFKANEEIMTSYYFDVQVDEEIDDEIYCEHIVKKYDLRQRKTVFLERPITCPDFDKLEQETLYNDVHANNFLGEENDPGGEC
jgi:hypothetical protein